MGDLAGARAKEGYCPEKKVIVPFADEVLEVWRLELEPQ